MQVAVLGVLIAPVGWWWLRHPIRWPTEPYRGANALQRWNARLLGGAMFVGGIAMLLGALVGIVLWGDHGEPRWPW